MPQACKAPLQTLLHATCSWCWPAVSLAANMLLMQIWVDLSKTPGLQELLAATPGLTITPSFTELHAELASKGGGPGSMPMLNNAAILQAAIGAAGLHWHLLAITHVLTSTMMWVAPYHSAYHAVDTQSARDTNLSLPVCAFDASEANARTCMSTTTAPSSKQEKPTLAGVTVKTRKRNIVVPVDPGSFADAVVQIVQDASDGQSVAEDLEAAGKALDAAEIEYSRYGDTLFEVLFAGGRLANGAALAEGGARLPFNILGSPAERDAIAPYIKLFQNLTRRRPFLVRGIENTMVKLLLSLEFFNAENRKKIALALALIFSMKIAVLPDNIFGAMLNDRLVAKGTVQEVFTIFCQTFLAKDSMDDLVSILTKAKVANQLLDYMPPQKRSLQDFNEHFKSAGLEALVEWNMKRDQEIKISELQEALSNMITAEEPASPAEVLSMVKSKKTENNLPERQVGAGLLLCACSEVLRVVWTSLMKAVNMGGKNQQQIMQAIVAKIKTYHKLLSTFATNGKLELGLLLVVQVQCYEDNRLLKLFSDIVRVLYDADIVGEDAIFHWYKKGSHPKGRNVFTKDIEPFIKWLEEAEEEAD
ncbi:hypothetical protein QJQ45_019789 [Haematococcus lacustris]|nr:hypothetical protein QJQ45_019789 [Haematococcus lacustris]